jgi:hypothetical protein
MELTVLRLIIFPEIRQPLLCANYDGPSTGSDYSRCIIDATAIHRYFKEDESTCRGDMNTRHEVNIKDNCAKLKEAHRWYFTLVFITDIVLVLCSFVLLLLFADWILFVAPVRIMLVL